MAFEPIQTQEEFDALIKERLERAVAKTRGEYADYDDLKTKASTVDDLTKQVEDFKAKDAAREEAKKLSDVRAKVAKDTGISADVIAALSGKTEEELTAQAKAIKDALAPAPAPKLNETGKTAGKGSGSADDANREFLKKLLGQDK